MPLTSGSQSRHTMRKVGAATSRPQDSNMEYRKREADCLPYSGDFQSKKVHDVIGNFPFTPWTDLICECYGLCRGIHAGDNRTVPLSPVRTVPLFFVKQIFANRHSHWQEDSLCFWGCQPHCRESRYRRCQTESDTNYTLTVSRQSS